MTSIIHSFSQRCRSKLEATVVLGGKVETPGIPSSLELFTSRLGKGLGFAPHRG